MKGFFAYPSDQRVSDAILGFCQTISEQKGVNILPWEKMQIGGKLLVEEICKEISEADLFCADISRLNPNVLFEIGYAIAKQKRIWLIRDSSYESEDALFKQFRILMGVGYREYKSSVDIFREYYRDVPHESIEDTIYDNVISPHINYNSEQHIFYMKSAYEDEASVKITQYLTSESAKANVQLLIDDPRDSTSEPIASYAKSACAAHVVICHLTTYDRKDSRLHNAKQSLTSGMAHGFGVPVLLLVDNPDPGPTDYREMMVSYQRASEAVERVARFVTPTLKDNKTQVRLLMEQNKTARNIDQLAMLDFGEAIAERESQALAEESFLTTSAYEAAKSGRQTIFVGNKGVGKTANYRRLSTELRKDRRVVVCEISPISYEFEGLVTIADRFEAISRRGFLFESVWKFLIYTEIASVALVEINSRPSGMIHPNESVLCDLMKKEKELFSLDFAARLDYLSKKILSLGDAPNANSDIAVSEILHSGIIGNLTTALANALKDKERIVILVDNLDKAWENTKGTRQLSHFFLGLLTTITKTTDHLKERFLKHHGKKVDVNLCVFLRTDVMELVMQEAPEPDKIHFEKIVWEDAARLKALADKRLIFTTKSSETMSIDQLWKKYFAESVGSRMLFDHIFSIIILRPRDLLVYLRASLAVAVNRRNARVDADDITAAEQAYSEFAYNSLIVETKHYFPKIEDFTSALMGRSFEIREDEIEGNLRQLDVEDRDSIIRLLLLNSFLQIPLPGQGYVCPGDDASCARFLRAARNIAKTKNNSITFRIHPAFWTFLLITHEPSVESKHAAPV
ncbi:MAG: hypothetical protein RLZZ398_461 [Verrucomicrobiota bacterium]|jgi:hypothetical protein